MLTQPVAVVFDVDYLAVMQQPVWDGGCDHRIIQVFMKN
jgi:hypothetical protein